MRFETLPSFRALCYEAARQTAATVESFEAADGVTPNFHRAVLSSKTHILCVRDEPLLAFTDGTTFIDAPPLAATLHRGPSSAC